MFYAARTLRRADVEQRVKSDIYYFIYSLLLDIIVGGVHRIYLFKTIHIDYDGDESKVQVITGTNY